MFLDLKKICKKCFGTFCNSFQVDIVSLICQPCKEASMIPSVKEICLKSQLLISPPFYALSKYSKLFSLLLNYGYHIYSIYDLKELQNRVISNFPSFQVVGYYKQYKVSFYFGSSQEQSSLQIYLHSICYIYETF